jgi:hypothetical protein
VVDSLVDVARLPGHIATLPDDRTGRKTPFGAMSLLDTAGTWYQPRLL